MDTQVPEHPTETAESEAKRKADYTKYQTQKGKPFKLNGVKFEIPPELTAAETVGMWKDDSSILLELISAIEEHAPRFLECAHFGDVDHRIRSMAITREGKRAGHGIVPQVIGMLRIWCESPF